MKESIDGLVLRVSDVGENDRNLVILNADRGKLYVTAKGARSVRSKYVALCRICVFANFELHEKMGKYWLEGGSVINSFYGVSTELESFALASYVCQIAEEITGENFPAQKVLQMTLNTLYAIENRLKPLNQIKAAFEIFAACNSGFAPDLTQCCKCGNASLADGAWLDVMNGRILCGECMKNQSNNLPLPEFDAFETRNIFIPLDASALSAARYVMNAPPKRVFAFGLSGEQSNSLFSRAAESYLLNHLERGFETLNFYHTVVKN